MLNSELDLDEKIISGKAVKKSIRDGFGDGLLEAGKKNPSVVALSADLKESTRVEAFAAEFPERFFEMGVAEQNMASVAAGLGISGKIPFISSYAVFSPGRNWEQIRTTIAYNDSNVKIAGHHAGVSTGPDGATHQAIEDIATMRAMPNMRVFVPCDAIEAKKATMAAAKIWGPVYLRFARNPSAVITTAKTPFVPGKAEVFWDSSLSAKKGKKPQVAIFACGPLVYEAILAASALDKEGIGSMVLNVHTIKPLDDKKIIECVKRCGAAVSAEEHNIIGGLGGAISELLAKELPAPMEFIGMKDEFGASGDMESLYDKFNLEAKDIMKAAIQAIKRKK